MIFKSQKLGLCHPTMSCFSLDIVKSSFRITVPWSGVGPFRDPTCQSIFDIRSYVQPKFTSTDQLLLPLCSSRSHLSTVFIINIFSKCTEITFKQKFSHCFYLQQHDKYLTIFCRGKFFHRQISIFNFVGSLSFSICFLFESSINNFL